MDKEFSESIGKMFNAGLILEGGGMRGIYTAGVLDFFLDKNIKFDMCIGVSAGASNACSYLSGQKRRAYHINVDYAGDKRYAGMESFLKTGDFFNKAMNLDDIPNKYLPYDYDAFLKSRTKFYAVATRLGTGEPEYFRIRDLRKDLPLIWASSSLPLLTKKSEIDGEYYLDGGVSDSIPIRKSIDMGYDKNVVVLTREKDYRKEQTHSIAAVAAAYRRYPKFVERMRNRYIEYNETLDYIRMLEDRGGVFVIRPTRDPAIGRLEQDRGKLKELYVLGYNDAKEKYGALMEYLS